MDEKTMELYLTELSKLRDNVKSLSQQLKKDVDSISRRIYRTEMRVRDLARDIQQSK